MYIRATGHKSIFSSKLYYSRIKYLLFYAKGFLKHLLHNTEHSARNLKGRISFSLSSLLIQNLFLFHTFFHIPFILLVCCNMDVIFFPTGTKNYYKVSMHQEYLGFDVFMVRRQGKRLW